MPTLPIANDRLLGALPSRRAAIGTGLASLSLGVCGHLPAARSQNAAHRIDVHHHLSPPTWVAELARTNLGTKPAFDWTPQRSIDDMDRAGIATAITSITTPSLSFLSPDRARAVARECNEYAARLRGDHKGRFGVFLTLPLPDIDGSLAEIDYGFRSLKADGVGMLTSYGDVWLGHPRFAPVFAELDKRKAVVSVHPTSANCCRNLLPSLPDNMIEWGTDTTRAIADIVFSGTPQRCPGIQFIFSHGGGTMPYLIERFQVTARSSGTLAERVPEGVEAALRKFYYDTAQTTHPAALAAFLRLFPVSQLLFGTDFPYRRGVENMHGLAEFGLAAADLQMIERGNAMRLLPRAV